NGRSFGKSMFGLQVKSADGEEITLKQAMLRAFAYFTCAMAGSFLFALSFIRKDEKSLADVFSGTSVETETLNEKVKGTEFQLTLLEAHIEMHSSDDEVQEERQAA
ncbi:MAG: RDD family protein, partial [Bdellovibrionales bacterium]|nr:RDD family protein [Bdellovibrionales bacterium]